MDKIYSRKRFILKPLKIFYNQNPKNKIIGKIIRCISIIIVSIYGFKISFDYLEPIYENLCNEKIRTIATIVTNEQSTIVMNNYKYDDLYTIEIDSEGNITVIRANVVPINNMISDLTESVQKRLEKTSSDKIQIPLGALTGIYLFSGFGPKIPIKVAITGSVDSDIKSEFYSQGINQTLHRVYAVICCNMSVSTPMQNYLQKVENKVIIAEHVIVGKIPENYYNLEGFETPLETLNVTN